MAHQFICYGIGSDMSKDHFHACMSGMTNQRAIKIIASRKFSNNETGFIQFIEWMHRHRKDKSLPFQIFMEVTGVYHESLLYYLHKEDLPACLEMGKRVKQYKKIVGYKSKNDKLDGRAIAQMACERKGRLWSPVSPDIMKIRTLLRHRKALLSAKNQFSNQLHAINHSGLKHAEVLRSLQQMIRQVEKQISKAESKAMEFAKKDQDLFRQIKQIADSVAGLGVLSVLTIVAETNGFKTFNSAKQLVSYAGLDVVENSSGKFIGKTRISKKGNAHLRANMYMPSVTIAGYKSGPFYEYYQRLLKRNGYIPKKAMVAVQRKLLVITYTLWKKKEAFDIDYCRAAKKSSTATKAVLQ